MTKNIKSPWLYLFIAFSLLSSLNNLYATAPPTDSLAILNISEINYKIEKARRVITKIDFVENDKNEILRIDSILDYQKSFLKQQADEFYSFNPSSLSKVFLANTFKIWNEYSNHIDKLNKINTHRFEKTDEDSKTLNKLGSDFTKLKLQLNDQQGYDIITDRVNEILDKIEAKKIEHYSFLKKAIEVEDKLDEITLLVNKTLNYTQNLLNQKKINTFKLSNPFIWNTQFDDGKYPNFSARMNKAWYENKKLIINQLELVKDQIPFYLFYSILLVLFIYFSKKIYLSLNPNSDSNGYILINRILISNNISVTIVLLISLLLIMFPSVPILLSNFLASILLILATFVLNNSISKINIKLIINFFIILTIYNLEILAWYLGGYARLYFLAEIIISLTLLTSFYFTFLKNEKDTSTFTKYSKLYIPYIIYGYIISAIAQIVGFLNLSILLNKILAVVPVITILVYMVFKVINVLLITISEILNVKSPLFKEAFPKFLKIMFNINKILLIIVWIRLMGNAFQLERTISNSITDFLEYSFTEDSYNFTIGNILGFIIILFATYFISRFTSNFLSNEKVRLSRKMPRGFFSATSLSLRMIFVIFGGSLAMAKLGLDFTKFAFIVGALGVGIGFGLQDLVNNFISGLILIYGRPIQTGDTVEVDSLLGRVKEIGIRSSVLVTYDGAEILVPNAILISNKLTNWTLSDNKRRVEVLVGVEYGSDLEEVIDILELAASRVDTILKNPQPKALFLEFGDSSLNFRLRFWVSYEDGLSSKSEVSVMIYKLLDEKGITIPFPQVDVHHFNTENKDTSDDAENDIEK